LKEKTLPKSPPEKSSRLFRTNPGTDNASRAGRNRARAPESGGESLGTNRSAVQHRSASTNN
jgi:hypothetical protein